MGPLRIIAIVALGIISGCQSIPRSSFCTISSPIRLSAPAIDAMSDGEVRDVLAHNEKGRKLCGWHP